MTFALLFTHSLFENAAKVKKRSAFKWPEDSHALSQKNKEHQVSCSRNLFPQYQS